MTTAKVHLHDPTTKQGQPRCGRRAPVLTSTEFAEVTCQACRDAVLGKRKAWLSWDVQT